MFTQFTKGDSLILITTHQAWRGELGSDFATFMSQAEAVKLVLHEHWTKETTCPNLIQPKTSDASWPS